MGEYAAESLLLKATTTRNAKPYKWLLAIEFLAQNSTADSLVMWNLPA